MGRTEIVSAKELAGILAVLVFAAIYALANPQILGATPRAKGLTVAMRHASPYRGIETRCAKESFPISCVARLVRESRRAPGAPLQAGEQMRSTPPAQPLRQPGRSDLCSAGSCATQPNEPTESWERSAVPRIDTVATR